MGILSQYLERRTNVQDPPQWLLEWLGGGARSYTGKDVTPSSAMQCAAVYACVRILAETIASLPLHLYRRTDDGGKERALSHPLYRVLHDAPNAEMTRVELWETLVGHLALRGNAYAQIVRDSGGRIAELWPLRPDRMTVRREGGELVYLYQLQGRQRRLGAAEVLHLRGLADDGLMGYSPIRLAREAIGFALATEEYGARFFGNDSRPGGVLVHPSKLSKDAAKRLKESWEATHGGLDNAHRVAVLEEGVSWQQIGIPPEDAQFLQTRKFQITEIARIFRIPPHMLADLDRATFSNIEHQSIEFVVHTIRPWLVRIEQRVNQDLLRPGERGAYFVEHLVDGLLRGDIQSRYQAYAVGRQNGWLSANDIRRLENMNPVDGGDVYLVPLNMIPAGEAGMDTSGPLRGASGSGPASMAVEAERRSDAGYVAERRRLARAFRRVVEQAAGRVLRREEADIMRQAEKLLTRGQVSEFLSWLEQFYEEHQAFVDEALLPAFTALGEQIAASAAQQIGQDPPAEEDLASFMAGYTQVAARDYVQSNHGQLRQIVEQTEGDRLPSLVERFGEWTEKTPAKLAMIHTVRVRGAVTKEMWRLGGVRALVWVTHGDSCPYCNALSGKVVGMQESFLSAGEELRPDGTDRPLAPRSNIGHAPAHLGCDCDIAPLR